MMRSVAVILTLALSAIVTNAQQSVTGQGTGSTAQEARQKAISDLEQKLQNAIRKELGNNVLDQYSAELRNAVQHQSTLTWLDVDIGSPRESGGSGTINPVQVVGGFLGGKAGKVTREVGGAIGNAPKRYTVTATAKLRLGALKAEIERIATQNLPTGGNTPTLAGQPQAKGTPTAPPPTGTETGQRKPSLNSVYQQAILTSAAHSQECVDALLKNPEDANLYYFNTTYYIDSRPYVGWDMYIDNNNVAYFRGNKENNVRSVTAVKSGDDYVLFFLKCNNELWAMGNNQDGCVGDDTGIDRTSPVLIMNDVANVFSRSYSRWGGDDSTIYAQKTDKSVWIWGKRGGGERNIYVPTNIKDLDINHDDFEPHVINQRLFSKHVLRGSYNHLNHTMVELPDEITKLLGGKENVLASVSAGNSVWTGVGWEDVKEARFYALTKDNVVWGWGRNDGKLGDGTRAHRNNPVKIAENVKRICPGGFTSNENDWYSYSNSESYTPQLLFVDCLYSYSWGKWFTPDGKLLELASQQLDAQPRKAKLYYVKQGLNTTITGKLPDNSPKEKILVLIDDIKLPSIVKAEEIVMPEVQAQTTQVTQPVQQPQPQPMQQPIVQPVQQPVAPPVPTTGITASQANFINAVLARQNIENLQEQTKQKTLTQFQQELLRNNIRDATAKWEEGIKNVISSGNVKDWVGEIAEIGKDFIIIKIHDQLLLQTGYGNNSYDRRKSNPVNPTVPFYNLLPLLNKQDKVVFSGRFLFLEPITRGLPKLTSVPTSTLAYNRSFNRPEEKITTFSFSFEFTAMQKQ